MKAFINTTPKLYRFLKENDFQIQEDRLGEILLKAKILDNHPNLLLNIVLELDGGSEYLFTEESIKNLENKDRFITMMRLFDKELAGIDIEEITNSLRNNNAIDYIE